MRNLEAEFIDNLELNAPAALSRCWADQGLMRFSERQFDFKDQRALQPLPAPSQLRQMAKTEAVYREIREIARQHPSPPLVLSKDRFWQLQHTPFIIDQRRGNKEVSPQTLQIVKTRTEQVRKDLVWNGAGVNVGWGADFNDLPRKLEPQMTDWFRGTMAPWRTGVYELKDGRYAGYDALSRAWTSGCISPKIAKLFLDRREWGTPMEHRVSHQFDWRGFTTPQE